MTLCQVSCETAVFISNSEPGDSQFSSNSQPIFEADSGSTSLSLLSSAASTIWAQHLFAAESRKFAAKLPHLELEARVLHQDMTSLISELCHKLCHDHCFHEDSAWHAARTTISKEISRDHANFSLSLQAVKDCTQRQSWLKSLCHQAQSLILSSATSICVLSEREDAVTLCHRLKELAFPKQLLPTKIKNHPVDRVLLQLWQLFSSITQIAGTLIVTK
jgi:hypothetical protein